MEILGLSKMGLDPPLPQGLRGVLLHPAARPLSGQGCRGCPGTCGAVCVGPWKVQGQVLAGGVTDGVWWAGPLQTRVARLGFGRQGLLGRGMLSSWPPCGGLGGVGTAVRQCSRSGAGRR